MQQPQSARTTAPDALAPGHEPIDILWVGDASLPRQAFSVRAPHLRFLQHDAASAAEFLLAGHHGDILVIDATLGDADIVGTLGRLHQGQIDIPVLLLCAPGSPDLAARVGHLAVCDCVVKTADYVHQLWPAFEQLRARHDMTALFRGSRHVQDRLRTILEFQPAVTCIVGPDGVLSAMNQAGLTMVGVDREQLIGRQLATFLPKEQHDAAAAWLRRVCDGEPAEFSHVLIRADGATVDVRTRAVPLQSENGLVALATIETRTAPAEPPDTSASDAERGRLAEALRKAETERAQLVEATRVAELERTQLVEALRTAEAERARHVEEMRVADSERTQLVEALRVAEAERALSTATIPAVEAEHARLVEAVRAADAERTELVEALRAAELDRTRLAEALGVAKAERAEFLEAVQHAEAERTQHVEAMRAADAERTQLLEAVELAEAGRAQRLEALRVAELERTDLAEALRVATVEHSQHVEAMEAIQADRAQIVEAQRLAESERDRFAEALRVAELGTATLLEEGRRWAEEHEARERRQQEANEQAAVTLADALAQVESLTQERNSLLLQREEQHTRLRELEDQAAARPQLEADRESLTSTLKLVMGRAELLEAELGRLEIVLKDAGERLGLEAAARQSAEAECSALSRRLDDIRAEHELGTAALEAERARADALCAELDNVRTRAQALSRLQDALRAEHQASLEFSNRLTQMIAEVDAGIRSVAAPQEATLATFDDALTRSGR